MDILPKAGLRNKRNDLLSFRWGGPFFSCSCKKRTKRSSLKEALYVLLPQSEPPSLRIHPAASPKPLEHLNLNPVQAENVPIFCLKFGAEEIGRAARVPKGIPFGHEPPPTARPYV